VSPSQLFKAEAPCHLPRTVGFHACGLPMVGLLVTQSYIRRPSRLTSQPQQHPLLSHINLEPLAACTLGLFHRIYDLEIGLGLSSWNPAEIPRFCLSFATVTRSGWWGFRNQLVPEPSLTAELLTTHICASAEPWHGRSAARRCVLGGPNSSFPNNTYISRHFHSLEAGRIFVLGRLHPPLHLKGSFQTWPRPTSP
jgi:hypothetical protein